MLDPRDVVADLIGLGTLGLLSGSADGQQFLVSGSSTQAANVSLYKTLAFDPECDFAPVTTLPQLPCFLVVNPAMAPGTAAENGNAPQAGRSISALSRQRPSGRCPNRACWLQLTWPCWP